MNAVAENTDSKLLTEQERQFQRVDITLFGRYMLENKDEYPCQILNMSSGSASFVTPHSGAVGEKVIAYIDHLGRLEGSILRIFHGGFAMGINATDQKRDKLAEKITWLANRHELDSADDRRHDRITPNQNATEIKLEDGRTYKVRIVDLSLSGAAIELDVRPAVGTLIWIGNTRGRVVRHFSEGVAVEFSSIQTRDSLKRFTAGQF